MPASAPRAEGPAAQILNTVVMREIARLLDHAWKHRRIVAAEGNVGVGKTTALAHWSRSTDIPHVVIECRETTRRNPLLKRMGHALSIDRSGRTGYVDSDMLLETIIDRLRSDPHLWVIDEADRLADSCFELMRDVWDGSGAPTVFVGAPPLFRKIFHHRGTVSLERLHRRIKPFDIDDLPPGELKTVLGARGWNLDSRSFEELWKFRGGSIAWAENILETATEEATHRNQPLDASHVVAAVRMYTDVSGRR